MLLNQPGQIKEMDQMNIEKNVGQNGKESLIEHDNMIPFFLTIGPIRVIFVCHHIWKVDGMYLPPKKALGHESTKQPCRERVHIPL